MLSRVANSIYWLNRYIERAENVARFIDANYHMTLDIPESASNQWQPLINTTGDHELFAELHGHATRENAIEFLAFERDNPNSIYSCVRSARACGTCHPCVIRPHRERARFLSHNAPMSRV